MDSHCNKFIIPCVWTSVRIVKKFHTVTSSLGIFTIGIFTIHLPAGLFFKFANGISVSVTKAELEVFVDRPSSSNKQLLWRKPHEQIRRGFILRGALLFIEPLTNGFPKQRDSGTRWFIHTRFFYLSSILVSLNIVNPLAEIYSWYMILYRKCTPKFLQRVSRTSFTSIVHEGNKWFPFRK